MRRISSRWTFYAKWILPLIWLIAIALVAYGITADATTLPWPPLLVLVVVAVVGNLILLKFVSNFVDEILDAGDALVIRKGNRNERVALADIVSVGGVSVG